MKLTLILFSGLLVACDSPTKNVNDDATNHKVNSRGYVLRSGGGEELLEGLFLKASPETGSAGLTVFEDDMPLNTSSGVHYHSEADECFYVLEGRGSIVLGDSLYRISKGDFVFIPAGEDHNVRNVDSLGQLKVLFFLDKDGLLKQFRHESNERTTLEALNQIANRYGTYYKTLE
jgi:mannose-6-phosphate isomerase-like protein (cupin superfamily)